MSSSSSSGHSTPRSEQQRPSALPNDVLAQRMHAQASDKAQHRASVLDASTKDGPPATALPASNQRTPPSGHHQQVVPAYPYNTSLAPFLSLAPHTAAAAGSTPDDSEVTTNLPSVQVDYLSHDWSEEDVWASWRATTKHKANIVNGLRLENASWRTWNKQRNNLKTISPETLNWLKDSDVTWLYGPLHTHQVEVNPRPRDAGAADRLGLEDAMPRPRLPPPSSNSNNSSGKASPRNANRPLPSRKPSVPPKKPILKYRSLSDILTVPNLSRNRRFSYESEDSQETSAHGTPLGGTPGMGSPEDSGGEEPADVASLNAKRRHIAFANRVEQCIAVDSDEDRERYGSRLAGANSTPRWGSRLQRTNNRTGSYFQHRGSSEEDDEDALSDSDEDDEVLTFRSSRHSPHSVAAYSPTMTASEHYTIAKLAPTVLKSSEALPGPSPPVIYSPETSSRALPFDPTGPIAEPSLASQPAAPMISSPLATGHVRRADDFASSPDTVHNEDFSTSSSSYPSYVSERDGDYGFADSTPSYTPKAAQPTATASSESSQAALNKAAVPSKSILKNRAPEAAVAAEVTGSETDEHTSDSSLSTTSTAPSSESAPSLAPTTAVDQLKSSEYETRGRPVARSSSGSSLDGRSQSRGASINSTGSSSPTLPTEQPLKGEGEDLQCQDLRLKESTSHQGAYEADAASTSASFPDASHLKSQQAQVALFAADSHSALPQYGEGLQDASITSLAAEAAQTGREAVSSSSAVP